VDPWMEAESQRPKRHCRYSSKACPQTPISILLVLVQSTGNYSTNQRNIIWKLWKRLYAKLLKCRLI